MMLSIVTPTWNRAPLLKRLYLSLEEEIEGEWEWLVIDDGSTDGTVDEVEQWISKSRFPIRLLRLPHGGKHRCLNAASSYAYGDWIMVLDSDDQIKRGSLAKVKEILKMAQEADDNVSMIWTLTVDLEHNVIGDKFPFDCGYGSASWWADSRVKGDKNVIMRKCDMRKAKFPEYDGEIFMAEGWQWLSLDDYGSSLFLNIPVVIVEYQESGISSFSDLYRARSPRGAMSVYEKYLEKCKSLKVRSRASINMWRYCFHGGWRNGGTFIKRNFYLIGMVPAGLVIYLRDLFVLRNR